MCERPLRACRTCRSRNTMSSRAYRSGIDFRGNKKSDAIRTKLIEKRGQKVHGLKGMYVFRRNIVLESKRRHDKEDEVKHEANKHHPLPAVYNMHQNNTRNTRSTRTYNNTQIVDILLVLRSNEGVFT